MKTASKLTQIAGTLHVSPKDERLHYKYALHEGVLPVLLELSRKQSITSQFNFIRDFFHEKVQARDFIYLPLPYFNTDGENFNDIVRMLAGPRFTKGAVKKFGTCLEKYGVNFLNNYYEYRQVIDAWNLNPDDLFNLDHFKALPFSICFAYKGSGVIFKRYTIERVHTLLTSPDADVRTDLIHMGHRLDFLPEYELREMLPRKPKSLLQLHDFVSEALLKWNVPNVPLEQDLMFLNGLPLDEYVIEVPVTSYDLIDTSRDLKHCVHGYYERVIKKYCQIINLLQDGRRVYTLELRPKDQSYVIVQFKGLRNNSEMETELGKPYQEKLLRLIELYLL